MREISYAEALREAMRQEMQRDEHVFLIGEDIGVYGGAFGVTAGLVDEFGAERVRDTPISETVIAGVCIGAGLMGMHPVGEIQFMDFVSLAMGQLVLQGAKLRYMLGGKVKVPMVLRMPGGGGTGAAAQHSESLENWFVHVPGLKVVMPSSPYDAKGLLIAAIRDDNPVMFVEHKLLYKIKGPVPEEPYTVPLGVPEVRRQGSDLTVVATSYMVHQSLEAAEQLAGRGYEVEVIDPRTLKPLEMEPILASVRKTGKLLVVHEAVRTGGFGGEIATSVVESDAFDYLDAPVRRVAGLDVPIPYSLELERRAIPQVEDIVSAALELLERRA
jgi:pyruvate/2-oxoglutarate/acetoin dehydrogenase E1 component